MKTIWRGKVGTCHFGAYNEATFVSSVPITGSNCTQFYPVKTSGQVYLSGCRPEVEELSTPLLNNLFSYGFVNFLDRSTSVGTRPRRRTIVVPTAVRDDPGQADTGIRHLCSRCGLLRMFNVAK